MSTTKRERGYHGPRISSRDDDREQEERLDRVQAERAERLERLLALEAQPSPALEEPRMPDLTVLEQVAVALVDEGADLDEAAAICGVGPRLFRAALNRGRAKLAEASR